MRVQPTTGTGTPRVIPRRCLHHGRTCVGGICDADLHPCAQQLVPQAVGQPSQCPLGCSIGAVACTGIVSGMSASQLGHHATNDTIMPGHERLQRWAHRRNPAPRGTK